MTGFSKVAEPVSQVFFMAGSTPFRRGVMKSIRYWLFTE